MATPAVDRSVHSDSLTWRPDYHGTPLLSSRTAPRATMLNAFALLLPAVSFVEISMGGRLLVTELVLLAALPWLVRVPGRLSIPRWFVVIWGAWLIGQVLTDAVVGSAFADYTRGWAKTVFTRRISWQSLRRCDA